MQISVVIPLYNEAESLPELMAWIHRVMKANHFTYLGDAEIGENSNIGAGTITCNYDGANKFKTIIGDAAFIGSNSSLVAPVRIGHGATVGAGSVITRDVEDHNLAFERSKQIVKENYQRPQKLKK